MEGPGDLAGRLTGTTGVITWLVRAIRFAKFPQPLK